MATLKFKVDVSGWDGVKEKVANLATRAERAVAEQAKKDTEFFTPFKTGMLGANTRVVGNTIIYPGPYSRYLYFGKLMVDPNTGSAWAKKGVTKVKASPEKDLVLTHGNPQGQAHWFEASKAQNLDKWLRVAQKVVDKYGPT